MPTNVIMEHTKKIGDWSEHVGLSGRTFYFNCKTNETQWRKPREWLKSEFGPQAADQCQPSQSRLYSPRETKHNKNKQSIIHFLLQIKNIAKNSLFNN